MRYWCWIDFFEQELATELAANQDFEKFYASATPAILFPAATVQTESANGKRLAAGVLVVGSGPEFWDLETGRHRPKNAPQRNEIVVNAPLAEELSVKVGDTLVVRFGKADQVPADSPLGRRGGQIASLAELKLIEIIPAEGLGRFGLQPSQISPRNAYVSLAAVQERARCVRSSEHDFCQRTRIHRCSIQAKGIYVARFASAAANRLWLGAQACEADIWRR